MATSKRDPKDSGHTFEDYFKRAASPMLVLRLLSEKPMYVYQMAQELEKRSNGVYTLSLLYPVIYRLVKMGYVSEGQKEVSSDNRVRQYYCITDNGRAYLKEIYQKYILLDHAVRDIIAELDYLCCKEKDRS